MASGSPNPEDQQKILEDALSVVKVQAFHMKRCLDGNKLMDALKHASTMLSELRTSSLTPKTYYELYMAIFDELRFLTTYLYVQYAGNIIPRLYLMITVGSVYMRVSKETLAKSTQSKGKGVASAQSGSPKAATVDEEVPPIKELMRDMLEMSRGVQHPTRGLFLRYYLSGLTRDYLPDGNIDGPHGSIHDSIHFILQNFIEMNKLWVRLQHQGHSRDKTRREQERKELRLLVGSNLVRLSQLDSLSLDMYVGMVLPSILDEIVSCKDVIAQEYLMEVIIQVFSDEFHLRTLDPFLSATAQLQTAVNVKHIVISLIDRFASFAERSRNEAKNDKKGSPNGIPADVQLFELFWAQITELVRARPEFSIHSIISLLVSLVQLSLNCYPEHLEYIDNVLGFAHEKVMDFQKKSPADLQSPQTVSALQDLLLAPVKSYGSKVVKSILAFPSSTTQSSLSAPDTPASNSLGGNYTDLLYLQPFTTRRKVSHSIANALVGAAPTGFRVTTINGVNLVFGEICSCMVREQADGGLFGPKIKVEPVENAASAPRYVSKIADELPLDWEDVVTEQELIAKLVHLLEVVADDGSVGDAELDSEFMLLSTARKHFGEGGEVRIRFSLPPLVVASIKLARKYGKLSKDASNESEVNDYSIKLQSLYKFIHQTISTLSKAKEHLQDEHHSPVEQPKPKLGKHLTPAEMALRSFLLAAKSANETGFEELAYEFFVQAFMLYEESVSESKAQNTAISLIIGTLRSITVFGYENYETLITKCALHCSRLLKRVDQVRGLLLVANLYWSPLDDGIPRDETKPAYRDGKKVLECLQKALKIADSVMDRNVSVELFVEILESCVWFYEKRNDAITIQYVNSLIDLIQTNLASLPKEQSASFMSSPNQTGLARHDPVSFASVGPMESAGYGNAVMTNGVNKSISESIVRHFKNVMAGIRIKQAEESDVDGFQKRWADIEMGQYSY